MDGLGGAMQNMSLAQEIANGLNKSLQKEPAWPSADILSAKEETIDIGFMGVYEKRLGKYIMDAWQESTGKSFVGGSAGGVDGRASAAWSIDEGGIGGGEVWAEFTSTEAFKLLAVSSPIRQAGKGADK